MNISCQVDLYPNISMHILHTVLSTFPSCLQGEFILQSRVSSVSNHFLFPHDLNV